MNIDQAFPELFLNKEELIWLPVTMIWQERYYWIWVLSYPRGTQQKSSWLTSTVLELLIFCTCLSTCQFYSIQMHAVFSDCPQPSPIGWAHLLLSISLIWLLFLKKKKKKTKANQQTACAFPSSYNAQTDQLPVVTLARFKSSLLPFYHTIS